MLEAGHTRIDLGRDLSVVLELEVLHRRRLEGAQLVRRVVGRRAAAPVELPHAAPIAQPLRHSGDLLLDGPEVAAGHVVLRRDDDVAAAVVAALGAEGQVDVEAQRLVHAGRGGVETLAQGGGIHAVVELGRRRVRGVPRPGPVVALDEVGGDC